MFMLFVVSAELGVGKIPHSVRPVDRFQSLLVNGLCERCIFAMAWLLGIVMSMQVSKFTAHFRKNTERITLKAIQY